MPYTYLNPDLDPKNKLVGVYNVVRVAAGKATISADDYNFSVPAPYSGPKSPNDTIITLTPKPSAPSYGTIILFYNRINLANLTGFSISKGTATTVLGVLTKINEELGVELSTLDVLEGALPAAGNNFNLNVTPECMIFYGSTSIALTV